MNLGIFLPLGENFTHMAENGQDVRFVEYYLKSYAKHFQKVYVFTSLVEKYPKLPKNCILVTPGKNHHRYIYGLSLPFQKAKEVNDCQIFRCFHPSATISAMVAKIFNGKKFVFNYNYDYIAWAKIEKKHQLTPVIWLVQRLAFWLSDFVFVADEKMLSHAKKYKPKNRIRIVRNGVDPGLFKQNSKRKTGKTKTIFSVGRLETQKNYAQLIDAVALLKKFQTKLLIVGNGSLGEELKARAKGQSVNLQIIDMVPNTKLPAFFNSADAYVQPSLIEAPVKTLLEAMSCGLPCIATRVPGISDVISDHKDGILADLSVKDLSEKIDFVLSNKKRAVRLGERAREKVIGKYNIFEMLKIENQILKSI